jgi:hypothetical protein
LLLLRTTLTPSSLLHSDELEQNGRTSTILLILFFLVFVFIDFGFYIKEAVDCRAFVTSLATVLESTTDRSLLLSDELERPHLYGTPHPLLPRLRPH